ncbi:Serine/threonine kinase, partial [Coemansia brasiliensis]
MHQPGMGGASADAAPGVLSEWDVESQGQIELWMNFTKSTAKRRAQSRLGRKAAVRKRRGPCMEMCGHHFYPLHTYSIMKCAVCSDHVVNEVGQQCDDCQMFVHQGCVERVVATCHYASASEDTVELGHRIPHRLEQSTNIGANWCCHCGTMLPIGRRALKCTECAVTCHIGCREYLPNMCGLDMVKASAMLNEIKRAKNADMPRPKVLTKRDTVAKKPAASSAAAIQPPSADAQVAEIQGKFEKMQPPSQGAAVQHTPASPIPPHMSQAPPSHQRANSNEFVPIRSNPVSPVQQQQQHQQHQHQLQQQQYMQQPRPQDPRMGQPGGYSGSPMQPPSYYQQQIQQAKGNYMPYPPQQQQHARPQSPGGYPAAGQPNPYQQQQYVQQPFGQNPLYPAGRPPMQQQQPPQQGGMMPQMSHNARQQIHQAMQQKQPPSAIGHQPPRKVGVDDFKFIKVLGKGNFGKVMLSEEKASKKLYAIKVLKKEFIVENDEFESTRSEKRVLLIANKEKHPFLIGLHSCFQSSNHIFFVMEYISGGDLMMHVQKLGSFGERKAKFFACEILLGLAYFHRAGIIYRDLKLDNIMLDSEGHVKIADYGL